MEDIANDEQSEESARRGDQQRRAEEAIQASEARFKAQYQNLPVATYTWRMQGRDFVLIDHNDKAGEITQGRIGAFIGSLASEFFADLPDVRRDLAACATTQATIRREMTYTLRSTGETRDLLVHYVFVPPDLVMVHTDDVSTRVRAERALAESETRYRSIFENAHEGIYQTTVEGRYVVINPALARMIGFSSPEEALASVPHVQAFYADPSVRRDFQAAIERHGHVSGFDYKVRRVDGQELWVSENARALRDERGTIIGYEGAILDISQRKRVEQEREAAEAKYKTLVERVPAIVYEVAGDDINTAVYMSPYYERMLGFTPEERLADPELWVKQLHPEDRDRVLGASRRARRTGEPFNEEYRLIAKDGRVVWVRDEAVLVIDDAGRPLFQQGIMLDITEAKRAEEVLRVGLEREQEAAERLRALDQMRNTFLQAVSHELRTPLTSVLGFALTLRRSDLDLSAEEQREMMDRLAANAKKLERLLSDLLDVDRLSRGALEPSLYLTDVGALAKRVAEETEVGRRSLLVDAPPGEALLDGPKVERIVENLLVNAARHTPEGTRIWLRVRAGGGQVLVVVEDDGPGISDGLKRSVFEPFNRGIGAREHVPGTGIGLSLVASFAELHGGRAWVEDRPGGGASFHVLLAADPADDDQPSGSDPAGTSMRVATRRRTEPVGARRRRPHAS